MQYWAEMGNPFRPQAFTKYLNQKKSNQMFLKPLRSASENIRDYACSTYRKSGVHIRDCHQVSLLISSQFKRID